MIHHPHCRDTSLLFLMQNPGSFQGWHRGLPKESEGLHLPQLGNLRGCLLISGVTVSPQPGWAQVIWKWRCVCREGMRVDVEGSLPDSKSRLSLALTPSGGVALGISFASLYFHFLIPKIEGVMGPAQWIFIGIPRAVMHKEQSS